MSKPQVLVFAGPNGSGKSTITRLILPQIIDVCDKIFIYDNSIMPSIVFKKDNNGSYYFPTKIWPLKKLKELLKC